jgi:two-component system chemotaxis response regulator CheB
VRALVVDDSKPVRSIVTNVLRQLQFECSEAGNGQEALDLLSGGDRPALITINWHMPVMDGIALVRALRAEPKYKACKLLMISTEYAPDRIAFAREAGVDAYVAKPFTAEALTREITALGLKPSLPARSHTAVRVLVVDDSATIRSLLSKVLGEDPEIEVVATAEHGQAGVDGIRRHHPDVVILDVEMPVMDGITALREIRRHHSRLPVIMFSSLTEKGARATLDALMAGDNDYVTKPTGGPAEVAERIRRDLTDRIKTLAGRTQPASALTSPTAPPVASRPRLGTTVKGVVVGVSTGGPTALAELLPHFAPRAGVPVLIVQHMPAFFTAQLADRLTRLIGCEVREAVHGQALGKQNVLIAPGGKHMEVVKDGEWGRIRLTEAPPENSCRPAVDVLFRTAASVWGSGTLGVVLTGMGRDGLAGSRAIVSSGGAVVVQDEFTSVVWGMPGEVARAGLAEAILPLSQLGAEISLRLHRGKSAAVAAKA